MSASVKSTAQKLVQKSLQSVFSGGASPVLSGVGIVNKIAGKISKETLGYDFPGLLVKILIFYVFALILDGIINAILVPTAAVNLFLGIFGKKIPNFIPQQVIDFYQKGYKGFQFWDLIHGIVMALIAFEAWRYIQSNEETGGKPSYVTLGVFGMIEMTIGLILVPNLYQKLKEQGILNNLTPDQRITAQTGKTTSGQVQQVPTNLPTGYAYQLGGDGNWYAVVQQTNGDQGYQLATPNGPIGMIFNVPPGGFNNG